MVRFNQIAPKQSFSLYLGTQGNNKPISIPHRYTRYYRCWNHEQNRMCWSDSEGHAPSMDGILCFYVSIGRLCGWESSSNRMETAVIINFECHQNITALKSYSSEQKWQTRQKIVIQQRVRGRLRNKQHKSATFLEKWRRMTGSCLSGLVEQMERTKIRDEREIL